MPIDTYVDALAYIYSYTQYDPSRPIAWKIERMQGLLARIGNPQHSFDALLIAGSKGKGSTAVLCASMLQAAGYRTGLYTSPHLHSLRERIRWNGGMIGEADLVTLFNRLKPHFEATPHLSAFEIITALALTAFAEVGVEIAVLEVGLGGRLDATNAVDPLVSVITSISYAHMNILGHTLGEIAREKAGIIRPHRRVIVAPQVDEAMQVIEAVAQERAAQLVAIKRDWHITRADLTGQTFHLHGDSYHLPLLGEHQVTNAVTAMTAVQAFAACSGRTVSTEAVQTGLTQVQWRGRMEILGRAPYVVVDSAMNVDSIAKLLEALAVYFPEQPRTFIFGASNDYPIREMLSLLLPECERMLVTRSDHPRATEVDVLATTAQALGYTVQAAPDMDIALAHALDYATPNHLICVLGSLYLVADAREAWFKRNGLPLPPVDPLVASA